MIFLLDIVTKDKIMSPAIKNLIKTEIVGSRSILTCVNPMILHVADQNKRAPKNKKMLLGICKPVSQLCKT